MTDPIVQTVNVTSATSKGILDRDGNLLAEIDMQLPANLINKEGITKAQMSVMKLSLPLSDVPQIEIPLRSGSEINSDASSSVVETDLCGSLFVGTKDGSTGEFLERVPLEYNIIRPRSIREARYAKAIVNGMYDSSDETVHLKDKEVKEGYHMLDRISDLIYLLNNLIKDIIANNTQLLVPDYPLIFFELNSNNSISLVCNPVITDIGKVIYPFCDQLDTTREKPKAPYMMKFSQMGPDGPWEPFVTDGYVPIFFIFNRAVVNLIPVLPWKKCIVKKLAVTPLRIPWPDNEFYILDTTAANIDFDQHGLELFNSACSPHTFQKCSPIRYNFSDSDVMSISSISSFVVLMRGVGFNQPVYPVNFKGMTDVSQAQTTQIPVIEVYYPFWQKTSDATSELIISKSNFRDSIPIEISPSLFRERNIRFKIFYITKNGNLRDVIIPMTKPFTMQIAFAIW